MIKIYEVLKYILIKSFTLLKLNRVYSESKLHYINYKYRYFTFRCVDYCDIVYWANL